MIQAGLQAATSQVAEDLTAFLDLGSGGARAEARFALRFTPLFFQVVRGVLGAQRSVGIYEAEDLVQESLLFVLTCRSRLLAAYRPSRATVRTYLRVVSRHHVIGLLRGRRGDLSADVDLSQVEQWAAAGDPLARMEATDQVTQLLRALAQEPKKEQALLLGDLGEGEAASEGAPEDAGHSANSLGALYARRTRLRKRLAARIGLKRPSQRRGPRARPPGRPGSAAASAQP